MTLTVLVVNDFAHVNGGAAQVALSSAQGLAERGYRVILLSAVAPVSGDLSGSGIEVVLTDQHEIANDPSPLRAAVQGLWNVRARRAMREVLRSCDRATTVVH